MVDIQEKMARGKNGGYVRWAKKYNVKQFAESILFLQQHDIHDKETLDALVDGSSARYHELMKIIKDAEEKMAQNKVLKTHIINYAKTRNTYIAYRKSGHSRKFYEAHRDEIILHKAAKINVWAIIKMKIGGCPLFFAIPAKQECISTHKVRAQLGIEDDIQRGLGMCLQQAKCTVCTQRHCLLICEATKNIGYNRCILWRQYVDAKD